MPNAVAPRGLFVGKTGFGGGEQAIGRLKQTENREMRHNGDRFTGPFTPDSYLSFLPATASRCGLRFSGVREVCMKLRNINQTKYE